ncbi:hypothetical protein PCE1_004155 [Barthelona sp. PCE]
MGDTVIVLGASPKEERFSNRAVAALKSHGHTAVPVHPKAEIIHDIPVVNDIAGLSAVEADAVSVYLSPARFTVEYVQSLLDTLPTKPKRFIFNPHTENEAVYAVLRENSIEIVEACTLIMLDVGTW